MKSYLPYCGKITRIAVQLAFIIICVPAAIHALAHFTREEQLKAAFFYKFLNYIQWDSKNFNNSGTEEYVNVDGVPEHASLCVLGESPIADLLEELVDERKAEVFRLEKAEDAHGCELLFIHSSKRAELSQILQDLENTGVVTVSDIQGFAEHGGVIQFIVENAHVRFIINQAAAERQKVHISSQLLALAKGPIG